MSEYEALQAMKGSVVPSEMNLYVQALMTAWHAHVLDVAVAMLKMCSCVLAGASVVGPISMICNHLAGLVIFPIQPLS